MNCGSLASLLDASFFGLLIIETIDPFLHYYLTGRIVMQVKNYKTSLLRSIIICGMGRWAMGQRAERAGNEPGRTKVSACIKEEKALNWDSFWP